MIKKSKNAFTLIELIAVIVILAILAVVAVPKYVDLREEAAEAQAQGVYGGAQAAAAFNFASGLVNPSGHTKIVNGKTLLDAFEETPDGWSANGKDIFASIAGETYTITVENDETENTKAQLSLSTP
jgi:MSHA pilin protein MshA